MCFFRYPEEDSFDPEYLIERYPEVFAGESCSCYDFFALKILRFIDEK